MSKHKFDNMLVRTQISVSLHKHNYAATCNSKFSDFGIQYNYI